MADRRHPIWERDTSGSVRSRGGRRVVVWLGVAVAMLLLPSPAKAASVFINVLSNVVTLTPTAADYARDYVEVTGSSGIQLKIKTNDPIGMSVLVRCSDPRPGIALADLLVRTLTPPGAGGASLASYTQITATDLFLWSTGTSIAPFFIVDTDVRVRNLMNYDDAPTAGATGYSNTLIFTVVGQ